MQIEFYIINFLPTGKYSSTIHQTSNKLLVSASGGHYRKTELAKMQTKLLINGQFHLICLYYNSYIWSLLKITNKRKKVGCTYNKEDGDTWYATVSAIHDREAAKLHPGMILINDFILCSRIKTILPSNLLILFI